MEVGGRPSIQLSGQSIALVLAEDILGLASGQRGLHSDVQHATVVLSVDDELLALVVEEVMDEQSLLIKPPGAFLKRIRNIAGVALLGSGDIIALLAPRDLFSAVKHDSVSISNNRESAESERVRVLLVEDSMITRTQEKRILEAAGYEVIVAVDGQEGWFKINSIDVDAVVSDIMMPHVDGFELTRRIRADEKFSDIPIVLVTTLSSDEDRQKGLNAGANAYVTKGGFNQRELLNTLGRLTGMNQ